MSRVLLVDTSFSSLPIYEYLISEGKDVFVIGANPDDFLAKITKNHICADYSNIETLKKIIKDKKIELVVPGCNDVSYKACAQLESKYRKNIDSLDVTENLANKSKFRELCFKIKLPSPKTIEKSRLLQTKKINDIIIKPTDSFSGNGISRLKKPNQKQIENAIALAENNSKENKIVIEEYIEGQLFSHSAFIVNKKIDVDFIVKEYGSVNPFVVDTSHVDYNFSDNILKKIRDNVETIAKTLELNDGLMHTQLINKKNNYYLIEITRRCPGDLYSQLIELSTGYPYAARYASFFINKKMDEENLTIKKYSVLRHTLTQNLSGIYSKVNFNLRANIVKSIPLAKAGDKIEPSPKGRIAVNFYKEKTSSRLKDLKRRFLKRKAYTIEIKESQE